MARVRLSADVDAELRRRVKLAAVGKDKSVSEWIEEAVRRELELEKPEGSGEEIGMPPEGAKPQGSKRPPRLRGGATMAEAVIEDRR